MTKNLSGYNYVLPDAVGKATLDALGNSDISYGAFFHRFQGAISSQMHPKLVTKGSNDGMRQFIDEYKKKE